METFTGLKTLQSFAPNWGDPDLLEKTLGSRRELVDRLTKLAVDGTSGDTLYQQLLVGARGSGKTHIVRVLHNRLRAIKGLEHKLVVIYLLEDQLGLATFSDFLMRMLEAIQRWSPPDLERDRDIEEIRDLPLRLQENRAKNVLLAQLGERKALILMENLGVTFDEKAGFGRRGQQAFRDLVQQHRRFMIFATSQALVEGTRDRDAPFYKFFETTHLPPLTREQAMAFLIVIAEAYGKKDVVDFLHSADGHGRMATVFAFTGGNHRLLVTFYDCVAAKSMIRLSEAFMGRLNPLRVYYQEQMRGLSAQQQKIVQYLALQRSPCTVKQIARGCMAAQNVISSQLKSLSERYIVSRQPKGRESFYELAESLFRIVYQADLEQKGAPVRLFVDFLGNFYSAQELLRRHRGYELLGRRLGNAESKSFLDEAALYGRVLAEYHPESLAKVSQGSDSGNTSPGAICGFFEELRREFAYRDMVHFAGFLDNEHDATILHNVAYACSRLRQDQPAIETARRALSENPNDTEAMLVLAEVLQGKTETQQEACSYARLAIAMDTQNPDVLERGAVVIGNAGAHAEALEHFEALTCLRAGYAHGWLLKGQALEKLDRRDEAEAAYRQALILDADNAKSHARLGILRFKAGGHAEALEHFETLTRLRADYTGGWLMKGQALYSLDRRDEAEAAWRQVLILDTDNAEAHELLGILRNGAGAHAEALEHFDVLTRLHGDYANGWLLKAQALENLDRLDEAEAAYRQALTLDDDNAGAHEQLGILRGNAGAHAEALEHFEALTRLRIDYPDGWRLKGEALYNLNQHAEAADAWRQVLTLDFNNAGAHERLGILRSNAGAHAEALEHFEALTRLRADYTGGWLMKGQALYSLDRRDEAEAAVRHALTLDAENTVAHELLGILRGDAGAHAEALEHFEALTRLRGDYPDGWRLKAQALENLGRLDESEAACRQVMTLNTDDAKAWGGLAKVYRKSGKLSDAEQAHENAIRLSEGPAKAKALNSRGEARRLRNNFQGALTDYQAALAIDPKTVLPRFNMVTVRLAMGDLQGALDEFPCALDAALTSDKRNEGLIVQSLSENWEAMFVFGHEAQWSTFLEACLRLLSARELMRYAEKALPLTVFALLRRHASLDTGRIELVIEHLNRDVAPFMDVSVAERFLKVGVAHFKEHDQKALMRLPREERQVFTHELGLPME